jgi:hypothetical protein
MQALKIRFPNSRFGTETELEWHETHDWIIVESDGDFTVWMDNGYGLLALTRGEELCDVGKYIARSENVVALDKDYYGVAKYIWK